MCQQQQQRRRVVAALAFGLALGRAEAGFGGFSMTHIDTAAIISPFAAGKPAPFGLDSAAGIAQAVKQHAEDGVKKVQDAGRAAQHAATHDLGGAIEDIRGQLAEGPSAVVGGGGLEQGKGEIAKALGDASAVVAQGSDTVGAATQSSLRGAVEALDADGKLALSASPKQVADVLRSSAAGVADSISNASQALASGIQEQVPKASAFLNRTAAEIAERLHPADAPTDDALAAELGVDIAAARKYGPLSGVLCLVLAVVASYAVTKRVKGGQRSPMLLSDALDGVATHGGSSRTPALQMSHSQEPYAQF